MKLRHFAALLPLLCLTFALPSEATMARKMDLNQLSAAAGLIFRGTVVDVSKGSISASGRKIPTITYQIRVKEQLKGSFPAPTGKETVVTIRSVDVQAIELPKLAVGEDYLLMTTRPSAAGLSTTVGLGQGVFRVYGDSNAELAVNETNNVGLASGLRGPTPYRELTDRIRTIIGKGAQQ